MIQTHYFLIGPGSSGSKKLALGGALVFPETSRGDAAAASKHLRVGAAESSLVSGRIKGSVLSQFLCISELLNIFLINPLSM